MKKKLSIIALVMTLTMALAACSSSEKAPEGSTTAPEGTTAPAGNPVTMKISHNSSPGSARDKASFAIKEYMDEKFPGEFDSAVYPSGQLGGQRDLVEGAQFGTIEVSLVPTSYLGSTQPLITMLDTPFWLPADNADLMELYASKPIDDLLATTAEKDILSMGLLHDGYKHYTANKSLANPGDVKGMKVRIMASDILSKQAEVLGATAITMDFGEAYSAMQSGAIDGQDNPIATCYDMKFYEVQSHFTLTYHAVLDQVAMVSKPWFDGLSADHQAALQVAIDEAAVVCNNATQELTATDMKLMEEAGTIFVELDDAQRAAWAETLAPVKEYTRTSLGEQGTVLFDAIDAEIEAIEAK